MPKACDHDSYLVYQKLIEPLRVVARQMGYAITVHGTLKRDIDLVAIPWIEEAAMGKDLAEGLRKEAEKIMGYAFMKHPERDDPWHQEGCPGLKPHGRLCFVYYLGGPYYIDLSVMPRAAAPKGVIE